MKALKVPVTPTKTFDEAFCAGGGGGAGAGGGAGDARRKASQ